jgi:hypothetical protein
LGRKPHSDPAQFILNETDAFAFECLLNFHDRRKIALNYTLALFNARNSGQAYFGGLGEILLPPAQKRSSCSDLCRMKHATSVSDSVRIDKNAIMSFL